MSANIKKKIEKHAQTKPQKLECEKKSPYKSQCDRTVRCGGITDDMTGGGKSSYERWYCCDRHKNRDDKWLSWRREHEKLDEELQNDTYCKFVDYKTKKTCSAPSNGYTFCHNCHHKMSELKAGKTKYVKPVYNLSFGDSEES